MMSITAGEGVIRAGQNLLMPPCPLTYFENTEILSK